MHTNKSHNLEWLNLGATLFQRVWRDDEQLWHGPRLSVCTFVTTLPYGNICRRRDILQQAEYHGLEMTITRIIKTNFFYKEPLSSGIRSVCCMECGDLNRKDTVHKHEIATGKLRETGDRFDPEICGHFTMAASG